VKNVMYLWCARFRIISNAKTRDATIEKALRFESSSALLVLSVATVVFVSVTRPALMQADGRSTYKADHSYHYCSFLERAPAAALSQPHRHLVVHIIALSRARLSAAESTHTFET